MTLENISARVEAFIDAPLRHQFEELAKELFDFQFRYNEPYRRFCQYRGVTPACSDSIDKIPAITTRTFKEVDLSVLSPNSRSTVFHSSGTTEHKPSRHYHSERTLQVYEKSLLRGFKANVIPDLTNANFLVLTPRSSEVPHSSLVHMFESAARQYAASNAMFCGVSNLDGAWSLDFETILPAVDRFVRADVPAVICGTAFSFVHLCDFLAERKISLSFPSGSRVFETGGYKGRARTVPKTELHQMISQHLGIPETHVVSEYGMSELSSQAYDRRPGEADPRLYRFPPWARAIVISPETGKEMGETETGLLRVIDLANVGSVMAVQTEDLARSHGAGFELVGRAALAEPRGCSLMLVES